MTHSDLRKQLREARKALSPKEREQKSLAITHNLANYLPFRNARAVAAYWATSEEVATGPLMQLAHDLGKSVYLPVINTARWRSEPMYFEEYVPGETELKDNKYGIPEPKHRPGTPIRSQDLDLIMVPLVGFNEACDRIGMGGGYYDRTLSASGFRGTRFIGIAFACQQAQFEALSHDVAMDAIVTETGIIESDHK